MLARCVHAVEELPVITKKRKSGESAVVAPELPTRKDSDEVGRSGLMAAISLEACKESSDGFGTWEAINRKQTRVKWGSSEKPQRDDWVAMLQQFHVDKCVVSPEVQCDDNEGAPFQGHADLLEAQGLREKQ